VQPLQSRGIGVRLYHPLLRVPSRLQVPSLLRLHSNHQHPIDRRSLHKPHLWLLHLGYLCLSQNHFSRSRISQFQQTVVTVEMCHHPQRSDALLLLFVQGENVVEVVAVSFIVVCSVTLLSCVFAHPIELSLPAHCNDLLDSHVIIQ
jgi:hypothetical protein